MYLPKVKEGAVIRDGFTVTNVESWHSGKGERQKLLILIINYRKAKERTSQNEIRFRKGGVRVEGEGGGQSGVRESYTAQSVVIFAPL